MAKVNSLYIYPVKSCKGVSVESAVASPFGLKYDREWIIINKQTGKMITQRTHPQMTQINVAINYNDLELSFAGNIFNINFDSKNEIFNGVVWGTNVKGIGQTADGFDEALNNFLEMSDACLMRFIGNRDIKGRINKEVNGQLKYADSYPYTIADTADLNLLNQYFKDNNLPTITMERFRANIVFDGVIADVGSHNDKFVIETTNGNIKGNFCEPCTRCPIPDLDPETGQKSNHQMQRSLKQYRDNRKDWFSTHSTLDIKNDILISVGDTVKVN